LRIFIDANLLVYLNTVKKPELRREYEAFYEDIILNHRACSDVLVLDEVLYISRKKYNVPYGITLKFIESVVVNYMEILPLRKAEYSEAAEILERHSMRPSDALHTAAMVLNHVPRIATEDAEFDKVKGIERVWMTVDYGGRKRRATLEGK